MTATRVAPNLSFSSITEATTFYANVFGLQTVMDLGWIATVADPAHPGAQLSLITRDATAPVSPAVSMQVEDIDTVYTAAITSGAEIVHPLTDEEWGVRRFFVRGPDGHVVNVASHR